MPQIPSKCQIPTCEKEPTKEVHVYVKANREEVLFLCDEHFKKQERYYNKILQPREIYDLTPKVNDRVKVQFT